MSRTYDLISPGIVGWYPKQFPNTCTCISINLKPNRGQERLPPPLRLVCDLHTCVGAFFGNLYGWDASEKGPVLLAGWDSYGEVFGHTKIKFTSNFLAMFQRNTIVTQRYYYCY